MYINLYVTVPAADRARGLASVITTGPAVLSLHVVTGLLLGLGAVGVLAHAGVARHLGAVAASVTGLVALALAGAAGTSFTSSGHPADSMAMSVLTGTALLCYAANLYQLVPGKGQYAITAASTRCWPGDGPVRETCSVSRPGRARQ
jgi:hypothetical protein